MSAEASPWYLLMPDPAAMPSGGNRYNAALLAALRAAGVKAWRRQPHRVPARPVTAWVDTLYLDAWSVRPSDRSLLIVHHLESLDPPGGGPAADWFAAHERDRLAAFDGFLVSSPFTRDYLRAQGMDQPILTVVPALCVPRGTRQPQAGPPVVLIVANLVARKGILPLLEGLAAEASLPPFRLEIAGTEVIEPAYAAAVRALLARTPALQARVHLLGPLSRRAMRAAYRRASLLVSAARMETFGMAMQEAVAFGLPILATTGGHAAAHVQPGHNGYCYDQPEELVQGLVALLRDPGQLRTLQAQAAAYDPYQAYDWPQAVASLLDQFAAAFGAHAIPRP